MAKSKKKKIEEPATGLSRIDDLITKFNKLSDSKVTTVIDGLIEDIPVNATSILSLDWALGVGGFPHGRIIEIYGGEASGKTTITLQALAACQARGGIGVFIDVEHALDPVYAANLGVDMRSLLLTQPQSGEEALSIVENFTKLLGHGDMIIVDSVAALVPKAELEGDMGDSHMGLQARLMGQGLRKLTGLVGNSGVTVVFINQTRQKIGVMFGSNETTTGGKALGFYASQRVQVRASTLNKQGDEAIGRKVAIKVVKNKVAPPFREVELDMRFGRGISKTLDLLNLGLNHGFFEKKGAWYYYKDQALGQGVEKASSYLDEHKDIIEYVYGELSKILFKRS